uniref:Uncharacterized protein n=1 Tax=Pelusios castaneus TaxID=367368 RepID=A0A8C8RGF1_9SAUR
LWVREDRIHPETMVQGHLQDLLQELRRCANLPPIWRCHPEGMYFLFGILYFRQVWGSRGPLQMQVVLALAFLFLNRPAPEQRQEVPISAEDVGSKDMERAGAEAVALWSSPHGEMQQPFPAGDVSVEHGMGPEALALGRQLAQFVQQGPDLVEIRLGPEQGQLRVVLRQVQASQAQEVEDVPESFAIAVNEQAAVRISAGRPGPSEHGTQHGVREAGQGLQRRAVELTPDI